MVNADAGGREQYESDDERGHELDCSQQGNHDP